MSNIAYNTHMKQLIALIILASATSAQAGLISAAATADWPTKQTKKYKLDMYGYDGRAYEFQTDNGMRCVAVFPGGEAKGWQMQCLPVEKPETKK